MKILNATSIKQIDFLLYGVVVGLALATKLFFSTSTLDQLQFVLGPVSLLVKSITAAGFSYVSESGYQMNNSQIVIDKSCSGINFFIIASCMAAFLIIPTMKNQKNKLTGMGASILGSFIVTIFVNAFRISTAISFLRHLGSEHFLNSKTGHHVQGIIFYFSFLIFYYLLLSNVIKKYLSSNPTHFITT
jgi:exosortase K